ncbi:stromal membrane-associated protein 1 isoform X3 [Acanthochromis polyacanthus]|uniref:stromal membrane-associated protein 1 isoform X3 n=1 Tax=Acanthochromis polyacanthus TaxID=80966 RepID=UPI0022347BE7|nr:stromal membrane-associated protein 1 isoform X3 [Acanthochromis polyacanthus]
MTTRSEREKAQKLNEQHQAILTKLLREEDNKYCADCEAKGPRWASWNLGVFMCIRCAGIHRNLGVHISRVKSVNLDQWTPEQIQSMVDMGNTRARQLYEAHLPESFRRPQTDQAVEVFIRDKYERKKYYDKEAAATAPLKSCEAAPSSSSPSSQADRTRHEEREKKKEEKKKEKDSDKVDRHNNTKQSECRASPKKSTEPAVDLLGLDAPEGGGKSSGGAVPISDEMDIFGPMVSNPLPSSHNAQQAQSRSSTAPAQVDPSTSSSVSSSTSTTTTTKAEEKKLLSKDSILSLYASSSVGSQPQSQQQPAPGQAGMYMGQPQMPFTPQGFAPAMAGGIPPTTMMGGGAMMSGMALPNGGYVGMQQGVLPANQGQNMYNMQQGQQQGQWNMSQMTQQMSGMALSGGGPTPGTLNQSGAPSAGWPAAPPPASGQTLSTQLWK